MIQIYLGVLHAAFDQTRKPGLEHVLKESAPLSPVLHEDHVGAGSLLPWLKMCREALESGATHFTFLPDDAILPIGFCDALVAAIKSQPDQILCFQANHPAAPRLRQMGRSWYTTTDGFTAFGGTFPMNLLKEYLDFRDGLAQPEDTPNKHWKGCNADESVNLFAMATDRLIFKSTVTLVGHDLTKRSLDGHQEQTEKKLCIRDDPERPSDVSHMTSQAYWGLDPTPLGPTYTSKSHWSLAYKLRAPMVRKAYELEARYFSLGT